jgi:hypothetical protein
MVRNLISPKRNYLPLVCVKWVDTQEHSDWTTDPKGDTAEVWSYGILTQDEPDHITIARTWSINSTDPPEFEGKLSIDRNAIKKITHLRKSAAYR